ncbi:hypothetical protein M1555_00720 [Patescibacteria group bacterium]|nr:hypothetical protein [Patescibacteria group bacterium]
MIVDSERYFGNGYAHHEVWPRPDYLLPTEALWAGLEEVPGFGGVDLDFDRNPRIPTNVSQIETLYPRLLKFMGFPVNVPVHSVLSDEAEIAGSVGKHLHIADAMNSMITQGAYGAHAVPHLGNSGKKRSKDADHVVEATRGLVRTYAADEEELFSLYVKAWERYLALLGGELVFDPVPLFGGYGLYDPRVEARIVSGGELREYGIRLARAWSRVVAEGGYGFLEFRKDNSTDREILVMLNLDCGLQIRVRLDSISYALYPDVGVATQSYDLKTGYQDPNTNLAAEIQFRQAQVMQLAAETMTLHHYADPDDKKKRSAKNIFTIDHREIHYMGVSSTGYRFFDKTTGDMSFVPFAEEEAERRGFDEWFTWYGTALYLLGNSLRYVT